MMIDIDGFPLREIDDLVLDPEDAIRHAIGEILPDCFQGVRAFWQLSSGAGFTPGVLKCHIFYWLDRPFDDVTLKKALEEHAPGIDDLSIYQGVQPHYVASPVIEGGPDPIPRRFGWIAGIEDAVSLPDPTPGASKRWRGQGGEYTGTVSIEALGDGEGLAGFHRVLRGATLAYARDCRRMGGRNDERLIETLRVRIEAAARRADRDITVYTAEVYPRTLIEGAFEWLDNRPGAGPMPEPPERPRRLPLPEARAVLREHVGRFFANVREWETGRSEAAGKRRRAEIRLAEARNAREITRAASHAAWQERTGARRVWREAQEGCAAARAVLAAARAAVRRS